MFFKKAAASPATQSGKDKLNPLKVSIDEISHDIIGIHDSQATRQNVDSLYYVVSNIVKNSTNVADFLDLKGSKTVEVIEDKVSQSTFMPPFSTLKKIACQMTCETFNASTAHETITGILGKLTSYTWDAKAVIALAAFALDYGKSWRLSLMQPTKQSSLQLHVFRLGSVEKPTQPTTEFNSLVESTLQVIEKIIALEKKITDKNIILKDVPALPAVKREIYTYWAIFALACASQITQLEWDIRSEVHSRLSAVLLELDGLLKKIEIYEAFIADYNWALDVIQIPSGILVLLKALIFLKNVDNLEIFDVSSNQAASLEVIKKQNLLLFISGLDNIQKEIRELKSIAEEFKKDKDKKDYRILWIPVVENWTEELKLKFENIKCKVPWYVVQHFEPLRGIEILKQVFHYNGKPIVVVTNPRGDIINENAMHMIFVWGIKAFPFPRDGVDKLFPYWNWFWFAASKVHSHIENWVKDENYIFLYGGVDISVTQSLAKLIDTIKKDPIIQESGASIEHFNLGTAEKTLVSEFWNNINNSFYSKVDVVKDIARILSKKEEKGWVLVSKGQNVLLIDSDPLMTNVLEEFKDWKIHVEKKGFEKALIEYYENKRSKVPRQCSHIKVVDIRSGVPKSVTCPDCDMKMEIESVSFKCCHGNHHPATYAEVVAMPNVQDIKNVINGGQAPAMLKF